MDVVEEVEWFLRGNLVQCWRCLKWMRLDESFGPGPVGRGHVQGWFCGDAPSYCWSKTIR
jgi:hypothetical protein